MSRAAIIADKYIARDGVRAAKQIPQKPLMTTLNRIRACGPCADGWEKLLRYLGKTKADDVPLAYATILESIGIEDATWCCRAEPQHARKWRLFAVWCARQVQHLIKDQRSLDALDIAEKYANGEASDDELRSAYEAAKAAVDAAKAGSYAAIAAAAAADASKFVCAADAATAAGGAGYNAAYATKFAACGSAATYDATHAAQAAQFLKIVGKPWQRRMSQI